MQGSLTHSIGIIEDQKAVRDALQALLEKRCSNLYFWHSAEEALHDPILNELGFLCVDLGLPHMNGIDLIRTLRHMKHTYPILVISALASEENIVAALTEGAMGFISKNDLESLPEAIATILSGGAIASPTVMLRILQKMRRSMDAAADSLSARERQVALMYTQGHSRRDIACALQTAENTVKNQIAAIYRKLQAQNKMELAQKLGRLPID